MTQTIPAPAGAVTGEWLAIHVFYAANPQPLLTHCVGPLVKELTEDGLLAGYFFINYWLEGTHIRLRLKPARPEYTEQVKARAEAEINAFLRRRPALYEMGTGFLGELYNKLFELEFPDGRPAHLIGDDGQMRMQPNNSFAYRDYEPEYGKYGGPAGIALAEWHFQHSSDTVLHAIRTMNLHLRPVLFGVAAQLMLVMAACFLPDRRKLVDFLDSYHTFWHSAFAGTNFIGTNEYARMYDGMAGDLSARFVEVLDVLERRELDRLPEFLRAWAVHCFELADRARELSVRGELVLRSWDGSGDRAVTDPERALPLVLSPYLHMTNNRFHVTIRDEAYLSYLLGRSLRERWEAAP
ncbi:lantibiotic dehydratase C-terminal domain-containing protein [Catellatospora citrea]|uniref:Lantibiotic biosynthesis protein n=1 Tax=Catellatospora citrea TaxID=53366 RepID=A0A8J3NY48_9ACTN|nr:lantibiotic dehydratase C-terminal domain-containing protein [Catellatospora citrea]RKE06809.1 thiopeptide-type bacteriocin biosynthesis protein [Catellatospora citrea]GIF94955.1 lantibiotic biosynthesis protein [Catellatospora citrea]